MIATSPAPAASQRTDRFLDLLENGDHLSASEFLRRYETSPEVKKAELINGIVYMASPIRADVHGEPDSMLQGWLWHYAVATPGVKSATNTTVRLGPDDVPQPDGLLRITPECGGKSRLDPKGYLQGAPELIVEIAASTASLDAREKLASYRRAGVREYLLWRTTDKEIDWWILEEDEYRPLPASAGSLRSQAFPGLWLDTAALLAGNGKALMDKLNEGLQSPEHTAFLAELQRGIKQQG